ncbi:MFS transporter [Lichenibacterium minor]|uniref:MFS transporter n=1 Tax=Lichenibacterium minor TaxID=2316528 RepID=A0A4Q2U9Y7_9HYPH|nr:MFS transporter [Lichenibacterium minor]RYC31907.1 MFS transporter [Lichenibacterium minor]
MSSIPSRAAPALHATPAASPYARIGRRLIPFLLACYLAALIDRLNLGFAKLQFLADLGLDEAVYGVAAGILYLGYILFEVPSNLLLARIGIRRTLLRIMVLWGLFTVALAFAGNRYAFYALRFLLGAAEAGFFPGVVFYLTAWFPRERRGRVLSLFAVGVPLSGVVAGPVSGFIMAQMGGAAGLNGWQWLFLLEGLPAIALGVAAFFYLPDSPADARFLDARDRERVARDLAADRAAAPAAGRGWREPRMLALAFVYFAFYAIQSLLLLWVPTLLKAAGVGSLVEIGWRAGAVSLAGALGMVALGFSSDRTGERRLHLVGAGALGALLFVALPLAAGSPDGTVLLLAGAAACIFGFLALFWTAASGMVGADGAAVGIALISSVGAVGSFLSPTFIGWMREATGSFTGAVDALAALMLVAMAVLWRTLRPAPKK